MRTRAYPPFAGLQRLADDMAAMRVDPVELAEQALAALSEAGSGLLIDTLSERAKSESEAARQRLKSGTPASALDGMPTAWKDLFDLRGRVTTAGSVVLKTEPPAVKDADVVNTLCRAGVVSLGTLTMTEFAYSGIGINPHYGTPRNPNGTGPARVPGGSSSGSAVAVARGILPFTIGTDTGGSVRVPAAFNGIVGYKASTGRYPMTGIFPLSRTLDSLGPLARSVADCALVDAVLRGKGGSRSEPAQPSALTLLVPSNVVLDGCEDAVRANFEASCEQLARAGAVIERIDLSPLDEAIEVMGRHGSILGAEAFELHRERLEEPSASRLDRRVRKRIGTAAEMTAMDLSAVVEARARLIAQSTTRIGTALVAFPTTPHVAPELAPLEADDDVFYRANAKTLRNTMLGNFLDWCGVSMPNGTGTDGMPTGFLLSAPHGRDEALLSAALGIEAILSGT